MPRPGRSQPKSETCCYACRSFLSNSPLSGFRPSQLHEQRFSVDFEYPVVFCRGALSPSELALAWCVSRREPERRHPVFAVLDGGLVSARPSLAQEVERYVAAHAEQLELTAPPLTLPGGEGVKNDPALIADLHARLARAGLDKQGTLLIIGGGAVLDAAGYAGSTTHRGVRVVRMPSTVLAQNDAGVGVKTSVNGFELLATLPLRDVRAGLAEAVKVALIRDVGLFDWLEQNAARLRQGEREPLEQAVRRCAELHLRHIASAGDPFERGSARPLDYGHWAAHKLETLTRHELRHGEAVSIGMALDACYAVGKGLLSEQARTRLFNLLVALGLPTYHPMLVSETQGKSAILEGLREFREHLGGALCITLLTGIGSGVEVRDMDPTLIAAAIAWLQTHQSP
jgi:3-dehydroquinate synthase